MELVINSAKSMDELCLIVQQYSSCDAFLKAVEEEFYSMESQYRDIWYQLALGDFSPARQLFYRHWNFFRHILKCYHWIRGIHNPDVYYHADGGAYYYYYSSTEFLDCETMLSSLRRFAEEFYNHLSFYMGLYEALADSKSKTVLFHVLKGRLTLNITEYHTVKDPAGQQYLDPDIVSLQNEVFCDIGAYIGDTAEILLNQYGDRIQKLYLYEPNSRNCLAARKVIEKYGGTQTDVVIRPCGVSDTSQTGYITDSQSGSQISNEENGEKITLVKLDDDILDKVTFIKMDIEGSELAALKGSRRHIIEDRPTLAICVYHQVADIRTIVSFIKNLAPDYRFYLRHYCNRFAETVLYCIFPS